MGIKNACVILIMLGTTAMNGQTYLIGTYDDAFLETRELRWQKDFMNLYYLEMYSSNGNDGGATLNNADRKSMRKKLLIARDKYAEWEAISKSSAIGKVTKDIKTGFLNMSGTFVLGNDWFKCATAPMYFVFHTDIIEGEQKCLLTAKVRFTANGNRYITGDYAIILDSVEDIDQLINILSDEYIDKWMRSAKPEDLLKD